MEKSSSDTGYFKKPVEINRGEERNVNCFLKTIISIYKNITIEPAMFVLGLAGGVVGPFFAQFEITKICKFDFGYNETVCNDENLVKYFKEENDEIQKEVNNKYLVHGSFRLNC